MTVDFYRLPPELRLKILRILGRFRDHRLRLVCHDWNNFLVPFLIETRCLRLDIFTKQSILKRQPKLYVKANGHFAKNVRCGKKCKYYSPCANCSFSINQFDLPSQVHFNKINVRGDIMDEEMAQAVLGAVIHRSSVNKIYTLRVDVGIITASATTIIAILAKIATLTDVYCVDFRQTCKNGSEIDPEISKAIMEHIPVSNYRQVEVYLRSEHIVDFYNAIKRNPCWRFAMIVCSKHEKEPGLTWESLRLLIKEVVLRPYWQDDLIDLLTIKMRFTVDRLGLRVKDVFKESFIKKKWKKGRRTCYAQEFDIPLLATWYLKLLERKGSNLYTLYYGIFGCDSNLKLPKES
ncbi:hypothetical protein L596_022861 [Steinernema carpocapsae]|uniref:F-box domain-containing protein n=1 Tax=Steinernema carpocapsae TaxID=34508 RepID=A0A4U5MBQ4_STECR|nr:hypothetical protein L596_022861 [Steinernema carpocapsae]